MQIFPVPDSNLGTTDPSGRRTALIHVIKTNTKHCERLWGLSGLCIFITKITTQDYIKIWWTVKFKINVGFKTYLKWWPGARWNKMLFNENYNSIRKKCIYWIMSLNLLCFWLDWFIHWCIYKKKKQEKVTRKKHLRMRSWCNNSNLASSHHLIVDYFPLTACTSVFYSLLMRIVLLRK